MIHINNKMGMKDIEVNMLKSRIMGWTLVGRYDGQNKIDIYDNDIYVRILKVGCVCSILVIDTYVGQDKMGLCNIDDLDNWRYEK